MQASEKTRRAPRRIARSPKIRVSVRRMIRILRRLSVFNIAMLTLLLQQYCPGQSSSYDTGIYILQEAIRYVYWYVLRVHCVCAEESNEPCKYDFQTKLSIRSPLFFWVFFVFCYVECEMCSSSILGCTKSQPEGRSRPHTCVPSVLTSPVQTYRPTNDQSHSYLRT